MFVSLPLSKYGFSSVLRWLLATPASAIEEFKSMKTKSFLDFEGTLNTTKEPVSGQAEILETKSGKILIYFQNTVYSISDTTAADILAKKTRVHRTTDPVRITPKSIQEQTWPQVLAALPNDALISGVIHLPKNLKFNTGEPAMTGQPTIAQKGDTLELAYARKAQISALKIEDANANKAQQNKDKLTRLNVRLQKLNRQLQTASKSSGLTPLGESLILTQQEKSKKQQKISDIQTSIELLESQIAEVTASMKEKSDGYSGELYLRY
jgi:hypothetical protein